MADLAQKYKYKADVERLDSQSFLELLGSLKTQMQKRRLFRNEVNNYSSISEHMKIVHAMLYVNNPEVEAIHFDFKQIKGKNHLDLRGNPGITQIGCSRTMPLHSLNVEGLPLLNHETNQMRGMPLEKLNIAGTRISSFSFLDTLPNLEELTISRKALKPSKLKKLRQRMKVILK